MGFDEIKLHMEYVYKAPLRGGSDHCDQQKTWRQPKTGMSKQRNPRTGKLKREENNQPNWTMGVVQVYTLP